MNLDFPFQNSVKFTITMKDMSASGELLLGWENMYWKVNLIFWIPRTVCILLCWPINHIVLCWNRAIYYFLGLLKGDDDSVRNAACEALATIIEKNCFEKFVKESTDHSILEGDTGSIGFPSREELKNEIIKQINSLTGDDENSCKKDVSSLKFLKVRLYNLYFILISTFENDLRWYIMLIGNCLISEWFLSCYY